MYNPKVNSPRTRKVLIGLTGPFGSGCSEIASLFDDDTKNRERDIDSCGLFKFLLKEDFIKIDWANKKIIPNHTKIDLKIEKSFQELESYREKISRARSAEKDDLKREQRIIFNSLKDDLEFRETLKSLDDLAQYVDFDQKKHHFTKISLSDLIIYNVLCNYHKSPRFPKEPDKKEIVNGFRDVVNRKESEIKGIQKLIEKLSPRAKGLNAIRYLLRRKNHTPDSANETANILRKIVMLAKEIKMDYQKINSEDYRTLMQDFGDNIRMCGNPFNYLTPYKKNYYKKWCRDINDIINFLHFYRGHAFFILDSFRNPYEALYFQERYTNFYLISINAPESRRRERLNGKFSKKNEEREQGKRVKDECIFYKQHVPRTVKLSDIAINNNENISTEEERKDKLIRKIIRYLSLIFDAGCTKPNDDEIMMNLAYTMAMKSNCISRQVGAVIVGKYGYVVGAGWNDVGEGQVSCGLREIKDLRKGAYDNYIRVFIGKDENDDLSEQDREKVIDDLMKEYSTGTDKEEVNKFCFCFKDAFSKKKLGDKAKVTGEECAQKIKTLDIKRLEY